MANESGSYGGPGGPGGPGGGAQGSSSGGNSQPTIYAPIGGGPWPKTSSYGPRDGDMHNGLDVGCPVGTQCVAPVDGKVVFAVEDGFSGGGMIHFEFQEDLGDIKAGDVIGWGHIFEAKISNGNVSGGQVIATSGEAGSGPHVHFVYLPGGNNNDSQWDGTADPEGIYDYLMQGEAPIGVANGGGGGAGAGGGEGLAKAAAFATFFQLATVADRVRSQTLTGDRSFMNDEPLFPFIQQVTEASLRNFQSMPNGNFFAFYPDYFGGVRKKNGKSHRTPYWQIEDTEIIDGNINLSDDSLATHVFIVGSWDDKSYAPTAIDVFKELQTAGVVTIFNAFMLDFLNGTTNMNNVQDPFEQESEDANLTPAQRRRKRKAEEKDVAPSVIKKDNAIQFLKKYGARPHYEQMPLVKNRYYELFLAYQRFCLLWSQQFSTEFELTFMPELFPGGLIAFKNHGIQCYIEEVSHNCSYSGGFTTNVVLSAPASLDANVSPEQNKNIGMIRAGIFGPQASAANLDPSASS
jgi:hypothetical protein